MLARQRDLSALCELIPGALQDVTQADGASLYLIDETSGALQFRLFNNRHLNMRAGFRSTPPVTEPAPLLCMPDGSANLRSIVTHCAWTAQIVMVDDAYSHTRADAGNGDRPAYDFASVRAFDEANNYRSVSFLAVALTDWRSAACKCAGRTQTRHRF
jgi:hypothetical protein